MSKNYDQYEVKITPFMQTSFEDDTWFYVVDIYYHEIRQSFVGYNDPNKIEHLFKLRMIASSMKECAEYAENIIQQYENGNNFLPRLSDLNFYLACWLENCWQSENDMWFVEQDDSDIPNMTTQDWDEIEEQVNKWFKPSVIEVIRPEEVNEMTDYLVCCYGSCINFVNWL